MVNYCWSRIIHSGYIVIYDSTRAIQNTFSVPFVYVMEDYQAAHHYVFLPAYKIIPHCFIFMGSVNK